MKKIEKLALQYAEINFEAITIGQIGLLRNFGQWADKQK
jgi:hypothetical protein